MLSKIWIRIIQLYCIVVHLTIPDAVLKERYSGKRVDPITGGEGFECKTYCYLNVVPILVNEPMFPVSNISRGIKSIERQSKTLQIGPQ